LHRINRIGRTTDCVCEASWTPGLTSAQLESGANNVLTLYWRYWRWRCWKVGHITSARAGARMHTLTPAHIGTH